MTTTHQGNPFDYSGVSIFKEDLEDNMKWLAKNTYLIPMQNYDFVCSVIDYWKTKDHLSDKQINAILPAYRAAQDTEFSRKTPELDKDFEKEGYQPLTGKPKFR